MILQVRGDVPSFQIPVAVAIAISALLVPLSGLFAGLTLGLLSLDKVGLRVCPKPCPVAAQTGFPTSCKSEDRKAAAVLGPCCSR